MESPQNVSSAEYFLEFHQNEGFFGFLEVFKIFGGCRIVYGYFRNGWKLGSVHTYIMSILVIRLSGDCANSKSINFKGYASYYFIL